MTEHARPPPLLLVTSSFPRAGEARAGGGGFLLQLAAQLARGFEVHVLHPVTCRAEIHAREPAPGVHAHAFLENPFGVPLAGAPGLIENLRTAPWKAVLVPFYLISLFLALVRLRARHPDALVQAHWIFPSGFVAAFVHALAALSSHPFRLAISSHGSDLNVLAKTPARLLLRFALARASAFTCSNAEHLALARSLGLRVAGEVITLGVDTAIFFPREATPEARATLGNPTPDSCVFVFTGNMVPPKGVPELLEAFARVNQRHAGNLRLALIGEGPVRAGRDTARDAAQGILWLGRRTQSEMADIYACCDAFVFPSHREGFPLSVPEALACGLGAIVSPLPYVSFYAPLALPTFDGIGNVEDIAQALEDFLARKDFHHARHADYRTFVASRLGWSAIGEAHARALRLAQAR